MFIGHKVSKEVLFELAKRPAAVDETEQFSYSEFSKRWLDLYDEIMSDGDEEDRPDIAEGIEQSWKLMNRELKRFCPPIRFVGRGSSRVAYDLDGAKCMKMAMNDRGVMQNVAEAKNMQSCGKWSSFSCFTRVYGHDPKYFSILTECCAESDPDLMMDMFTAVTGDVHDNLVALFFDVLFRLVVDHRCDLNAARKWANERLAELDANRNARLVSEHARNTYGALVGLCRVVSAPKGPIERVVSDLVKFYQNNGNNDDRMLISDLQDPDNWGLAVRDGQVVPVIVDAGFSAEVARFY